MEETSAMCPSAPAEAGALLLGRFVPAGNLVFAAQPLPVTVEFIEAASEGGDLGKRFRFTSPCLKHGCSRWQNGACIVGVAAARAAGQFPESAELPACVIRASCRWFEQQGALACRACPHVIYDMREAEVGVTEPAPAPYA